MSDFSLTTLFVVPSGSGIASSGSTQALIAGKLGVFKNDYSVATFGNIAAAPYFYIAQGRSNTYLQGTKRSDKISGKNNAGSGTNVTEWYKVTGCGTSAVQITDVSNWNVKCGDIVTLTLRAHSSYIDTLYFNGFTRSVTVQAPCCDCGGDPCDTVDTNALINQFIAKLTAAAPGDNPDNISFSTFYNFENFGGTILRISGKPLNKYGVPSDVAAFPYEYDRMYFRTFVYSGPATTADFIVDDNCNIVATSTITQRSSYPDGTADEIRQLEKNFSSYQAGYLKHLYRMAGYNQNFESWVTSDTAIYNTYYIKFNEYDKSAYQWGDYIHEDSMVIIAVIKGSTEETDLYAILSAALGAATGDNSCITTTTTTSYSTSTTTTTATPIP